jgi:D-alanyl-D-alanine carboxypeptidase
VTRGSARRRGPDDDIPQARRSHTLGSTASERRARTTGLLLGTALPLVLLGLWWRSAPLGRQPAAAPPVPGLKARLSVDGRLLGHFPYPEARPEQLVSFAPGLQLRPEAAESLRRLRAAAAADGVAITVLSGFRDGQLQRELFFDVKAERNQSARERAQVSAPPGFSEHATGYAVDLGDGRQPGTNLSPAFDTTEAYRWLKNHAARFHFELSFPRANRQGVSYEPWHWRYEGSTTALRLFEAAQRLQR